MKLKLPCEYAIIGVIKPGNNRTFVAIERYDEPKMPFATYEVYEYPDTPADCRNGYYTASRYDALNDMIERALASNSEWRNRGQERRI